jgi:hypothetical protein
MRETAEPSLAESPPLGDPHMLLALDMGARISVVTAWALRLGSGARPVAIERRTRRRGKRLARSGAASDSTSARVPYKKIQAKPSWTKRIQIK